MSSSITTVPPSEKNSAARAALIAARSARGFATWNAFFEKNAINDATWSGWLRGSTVRLEFTERCAIALGMQRGVLCRLRDQIVEHERKARK
jgi:hypothetical protein